MSEFLFVLKSLVFTVVLVVMMQLKVAGVSVEDRAFQWMRKSPTSLYVQSVAAGGVAAIRNFSESIREGIAGTIESYKEGAEQQAQR